MFTGEEVVVKSDKAFAATRSSSETPQESEHVVPEAGCGISKHDCCAHWRSISNIASTMGMSMAGRIMDNLYILSL
jgi:hypothetical protein